MNKLKNIMMVVAMGMSMLVAVPAMAQVQTGPVTPNELLPNDQIQPAIGLANTDIRVTVARIIRVAMSLLGIIAVVIVLVGGFIWMTAGGNDDKVAEAKKWIYSGIIGLAIILAAYSIATFVINNLTAATSSNNGTTI